ncbi:MAG: hypothetical protein JJ899_02260 [Alphaproteobacteria bacterium]|nr:hypothetical protein [Alphaproteobacteria bacterium]
MSEQLLAEKGRANPAAAHHGGESRFQARRVVVLPPLTLGSDVRTAGATHDERTTPRRPAARMSGQLPGRRKKFTFRIEPDRHERFCRHADALGISRQELLTRALDAFLDNAEKAGKPHPGEQALLPLPDWNVPRWHDLATDAR